jgi:hypothetical protein
MHLKTLGTQTARSYNTLVILTIYLSFFRIQPLLLVFYRTPNCSYGSACEHMRLSPKYNHAVHDLGG